MVLPLSPERGWSSRLLPCRSASLCTPTSALAGHLYSLAIHWLEKGPRRFTPWQSSRSSRPNSSKAGPDPAAFRELCSATDLALCATKTMAQAFCRSIANLVVLECHLWLTLTEIMECVQCPLPGVSSLPPWPVRTHCGRVRRALHCGTEVDPGNARLPSSKVFLKPRHGYVPKVLLTAHFNLCAFSLRRGPGTEITLPN